MVEFILGALVFAVGTLFGAGLSGAFNNGKVENVYRSTED